MANVRVRRRAQQQAQNDESKLEAFLKARPWEETYEEGKPLFSVKSEVCYNGMNDPSVPLPEFAARISVNDVIQVAKILDDDWWVGRVVGQGLKCRYIPSPSKWWQLWEACGEEMPKTRRPRLPRQQKKVGAKGQAEASSSSAQDASLAAVFNKARARLPADFLVHARSPHRLDDCYTIVPNVRPLVFFGPSKSGFATSDLMQRALMTYLVQSFPGRVVFMECELKREMPELVALTSEGQRVADPALMDQEPLKPDDVARIYDLAREGKMAVVQCDSDRPEELKQSCTLPLLVLVRMSNPGTVLPRLANDVADAKHKLSAQIAAAEKLNAMDDSMWDLILRRCRFDVSCYEVAAYVDAYIGECTLDLTMDPRMLCVV